MVNIQFPVVPPVTSLLDLVPDETLLVPANAPSESIVGDIEQGGTTGITDNTRTFLLTGNQRRVAQSGTIKKVRLWTGGFFTTNKANLNELYIVIYRKDGSTYDEIDRTPNIATEFKALTSNDEMLDHSLDSADYLHDIEIGDYVALQFISNGSTVSGIFNSTDNAQNRQIFLDGTLAASNVDFEGTGTGNSAFLDVQVFMSEPWGNYLGDSLGEGTPQSEGKFDDNDNDFDETKCLPYKLQVKLGRNIHQSSWGEANSTTAAILADITDRIDDIRGKVVFVAIGTNDVNAGTAQATFESNYVSILGDIAQNGSIPVIIGIPPRGDLNDTKQQARIDYNVFLRSIAAANDYLFVEMDSQLGQRKAAKEKYNEWDILTSFDSGDTIHYTDTGYDKMADKIEQAIRNNENATTII